MILLNEITIKNFLSHKDTSLIFTESDKLLIDGCSGSGKSSIVEAIIWVLYGKGRSDSRSLIQRGSKTATVTLKLMDRLNEIIITRSISDKGKTTLTVIRKKENEEEFISIETTGLKDTQKWIEEILLKSSYELFINSICYTQGNEESFVKANASKRKDLLLEIVRAGNFYELYEKVRNIISVKESENSVNSGNIKILEQQIKDNTLITDKENFYKEESEKISKELDSEIYYEKNLEGQENLIKGYGNEIKTKESHRSVIVNSILNITKQLYDDEETLNKTKNIDIVQAKKDVERIDTLIKEVEVLEETIKKDNELSNIWLSYLASKPTVSDYTKDIDEINTRLIPLVIDSGSCPAGDKCPFTIPIQGQIKYLKEQITEREFKAKSEKELFNIWEIKGKTIVIPSSTDRVSDYDKLQSYKQAIKDLSKSKELVIQYETLQQTVESIHNRFLNLNNQKLELNKELLTIDADIKVKRDLLNAIDVNKLNIILSTVRIHIQELRKKKEEYAINLALVTKAQEDIKISTINLIKAQKEVKKISEDLESLNLLKEALSSTGIKATIVDYIVPELEQRINDVLSQMSDFRIRLDTQQPKADIEEGVKEGLFITIKNSEGVELPISNLSGGEGVKVSMAISEGLAGLGSSVGFRLLDECINSLDDESTQSFVEVLLKLQEKFPQVLVISHLSSVKEIFEKKIEIIKVNGISKIYGNV